MMMDQELKNKIEKMPSGHFFRLETSRNKNTGGTGLGLSIANNIILSHGGKLELLSSPLGGLRVKLSLPQ